MKVHHFGYLTASVESSYEQFKVLGYTKAGELFVDNDRGILIQFIQSESGELIELIQPNAAKSVVDGLMKSSVNKIYHICYLVANIDEKITQLQRDGFVLIAPPAPAIALNNQKVAFLYSKFSGIVELYEAIDIE